MPISIWQRRNPSWHARGLTGDLLTLEWDAQPTFITLRNGYIQMEDTVADASGDSLQAFDKQNTLSTRTERAITYLDKALIAVRIYSRKHYTPHPKPKRGVTHGNT
jgi:hypothetical protein